MKHIGAYEAKTHLPALLKRVAAGEHIVITRHGRPIAQLLPITEPAADPARTVGQLKKFRQGRRLDGLTLGDLIAEGRS